MEFWGVEIKPGQTVKVEPGENKYLHLSQASIGETKAKENENSLIYVKVNDQKLVLGSLSTEKCPQIQYDLVFEKEFQLFHSSKNASVYLCGYKTDVGGEDGFYSDSDESDSDADQNLLLDLKANGKAAVKDEHAKATAGKASASKADVSAAKAKSKVEEPKKADNAKASKDEDEDDKGDEDDSEDESDDDEDMAGAEDDSDDDEEDSSDEEEENVVKKPELPNKRKPDSSLKAPVPAKKAKNVSPGSEKSQKKGGAGKKDDKSKQQTPKSGGSVSCKSCGKNFNSDNALQSHTKAKHSAGK